MSDVPSDPELARLVAAAAVDPEPRGEAAGVRRAAQCPDHSAALARHAQRGPRRGAVGSRAGALQGAAAALLAMLAIAASISLYGDGISHALAGALGSVQIALPAASILVVFVALGAGLGLVGGGIAGASRAAR